MAYERPTGKEAGCPCEGHYGFSRMRKAIMQGVTLLGESEPQQGEECITRKQGHAL